MRLIDADALLDYIDVGHYRSPSEPCFSENDIASIISRQEKVDAVQVVRCKDCQWYDNEHFRCENEKHFYISTSWDIWISRSHDPDHFCANGKRKDGDSDDRTKID